MEQKQGLHGATNIVSEETLGKELAVSAENVQGQEYANLEKTFPATTVDQKPRRYVLASSNDLFQSLYPTATTPPSSPGGASSNSTLVDPSSRKVSPSDSTIGAKASPPAAKDFAYPSLDGNHVRDPASIVEENTKLELTRQLLKKTAGEKKAIRKAGKQKARNNSLTTKLEAVNAQLQSRGVHADLATMHANAMILSNVVLRQIAQDSRNELSQKQHGAEAQANQSAGETDWNEQKEGSVHNQLGSADTVAASAYARMKHVNRSPDEPSKDFDDVEGQGRIEQESTSPMGELADSEQSGSIEFFNRQASEEPQNDDIASKDSTNTSQEAQPEANAEQYSDVPEGNVEDSSKDFGVDTMNALNPAVSEAFNEAKAYGVNEVTDKLGVAIDQDNGRRGLNIYDIIWTDNETEDSSYSEAWIDHLRLQQDIAEAKVDQMYLILKVLDPVAGSDEATANLVVESVEELTSEDYGSSQFSKATGPATLWGILQSDQHEHESTDQVEDTAADEAGVYEATGPATLWGILRSDWYESDVEGQTTCGVASETFHITRAEGGDLSSGVGDVQRRTHPDTSSIPLAITREPAPISLSAQPTGLSKTQKRRLERKRAAEKKAEAADQLRRME